MLVNFVVVLTILLGCCGLALDVGLLEFRRLQMQNAADAAAMGAMMEAEGGNSDWVVAGRDDAQLNGFTDGTSGVSVTVTNPPTTGNYVNNLAAYQATVSQPVGTLFMGTSITVQAHAVALMPPCGYFMATSTSYPTIGLASAKLYAHCPMYVSQNMYVDGFAIARYDAWFVSGSSGATSTSNIHPTPLFDYPAMSDPLSYVASPAPFSPPCLYTSLSIPATPLPTLYPGTYCGTSSTPGLTITSGTVTFQPGLYTITGGLNWNNATVTGSNVTLFMTKGGTANYGQLLISNSTVSMSAPNANYGAAVGSVTGVLIFGDRSWTGTSQDIQLQSDSFNSDGIIYFLKTGIYEYNSTIVPPHYFCLVIDNLSEFLGNKTVHLESNFSGVQGGNPFRPRESLVE